MGEREKGCGRGRQGVSLFSLPKSTGDNTSVLMGLSAGIICGLPTPRRCSPPIPPHPRPTSLPLCPCGSLSCCVHFSSVAAAADVDFAAGDPRHARHTHIDKAISIAHTPTHHPFHATGSCEGQAMGTTLTETDKSCHPRRGVLLHLVNFTSGNGHQGPLTQSSTWTPLSPPATTAACQTLH